jgi:hypothetical protein
MQPDTSQSNVAINDLTASTDSEHLHQQPMDLQATNLQTTVIQKTHLLELIIHYTHEKRFDSLKRDMHKIYHTDFQNTPVDDIKMIVGTRNRRDARNDLSVHYYRTSREKVSYNKKNQKHGLFPLTIHISSFPRTTEKDNIDQHPR